MDVVVGANAELRCYRIRAGAYPVADGREHRALNMIAAEQIGMPRGDPPTSQQAESDH